MQCNAVCRFGSSLNLRSEGNLLEKKTKKREMASNFATKEDHHDNPRHHHHHHHHHQAPSPRGAVRRTWSSNSTCGQGAAVPKCVCAPATHAGSFKCRLHRTSSHGQSPPSPTSIPPPPPVNSSRTPTVEAQ